MSEPENLPAVASQAADASTTEPAPRGGFRLSGGALAVALLLAAIAFFYCLTPLWHTDVWGHLAYGSWIVEHGRLPQTEPFCEFSDKETPLVHFAWGSQLLFLAVFRLGERLVGGDDLRQLAGGVAGLRTLSVVVVALFSWQLALAYRNAARSLPLAAIGLLLYVLLAPTAMGVLRPQVFGMLFFAVLLARLSRDEWTWRDVALAVVLFLLWVNLHGSFIVGLGLVGVFAAGRFLSRSFEGGRLSIREALADRHFQRLVATGLLGGLATLANPHGPGLYRAVAQFSGHPVTRMFDEFQPLNLVVGPGALYLYVASVVVLLGSWLVGWKRPSATQLLLVLAFGLAPIGQRRLLMWWMPLVPFLIMPAWAALAERRRWAWATGAGTPTPRYAFVACVAALAVLPWVPGLRAVTRGPEPLARSVTSVTPWELARQLDGRDRTMPRLASHLEQSYPGGRFQGRIFTSETLGDYLIWSVPDRPVVAYTHSHVFEMGHWKGVMAVKSGEPGWNGWLDRWGVNLVAVEAATHPALREAVRKDQNWLVVRDDVTDTSASRVPATWVFVAVRKTPR